MFTWFMRKRSVGGSFPNPGLKACVLVERMIESDPDYVELGVQDYRYFRSWMYLHCPESTVRFTREGVPLMYGGYPVVSV